MPRQRSGTDDPVKVNWDKWSSFDDEPDERLRDIKQRHDRSENEESDLAYALTKIDELRKDPFAMTTELMGFRFDDTAFNRMTSLASTKHGVGERNGAYKDGWADCLEHLIARVRLREEGATT